METQIDLKYEKILDFMVAAGKRLLFKAGNIQDIGVTKINLTEEDLAIERGLKDVIKSSSKDAEVFAEEENGIFKDSKNLWVIDPISGTHQFIRGLPHYSIVVTHLLNHQPQFAAVYDPSADELFTAYSGKGSFLNQKPIRISKGTANIIIRTSSAWSDPAAVDSVKNFVAGKNIENNTYSMAVNYCSVARGKADGIISFSKDAFPEFAGQLIIKEAGGVFTNVDESEHIQPGDRIFIGGNKSVYAELLSLIRQSLVKI